MFRNVAFIVMCLAFIFGCNRSEQPQPKTHWLAKEWDEAEKKAEEDAKKEPQEGTLKTSSRVPFGLHPPLRAPDGEKPDTEKDANAPSVTINANAFRAFLIVSKLKETRAKINIIIVPKQSTDYPRDEEGLVRTLLDFTADVSDEIERTNIKGVDPEKLQRLKNAVRTPTGNGEGIKETIRIFEDYLGIKDDTQNPFRQLERLYWVWLKRDKRVTFTQEPKEYPRSR